MTMRRPIAELLQANLGLRPGEAGNLRTSTDTQELWIPAPGNVLPTEEVPR